jgi:small subunit ribosomal protein S13
MNFKKFGLGINSIKSLSSFAGLNKRLDCNFILQKHKSIFRKLNYKRLTNKKLYDNIKYNINFYKRIKSYKGMRHKNNYPVRGQRTHTNAKKKNSKSKKFL